MDIKNFILVIVIVLTGCIRHQTVEINSPDKALRLELKASGNLMQLNAFYKNDTLLWESVLGFSSIYTDQKDVRINRLQHSAFDETWEAVNGKNRQVRNHYNQCIISCSTDTGAQFFFQINLRCYNDGFAYKYIIPEQDLTDSITVIADAGKLCFLDDFTFWSYNGEHHNIGPVKRSEKDCPEAIRPPMVKLQLKNMWLFLKAGYCAMHPSILKLLVKISA